MRYILILALLIPACGNGDGEKCGNDEKESGEICDGTDLDVTGWTSLTVGEGGGYDYDNIQAAYDQAVTLGAADGLGKETP